MKPGDMVWFVGDRSCIGVVLSISPIPDTYRDSAGIEPINAVAVLWNECPGLLGEELDASLTSLKTTSRLSAHI
jgi:hypothetical protein